MQLNDKGESFEPVKLPFFSMPVSGIQHKNTEIDFSSEFEIDDSSDQDKKFQAKQHVINEIKAIIDLLHELFPNLKNTIDSNACSIKDLKVRSNWHNLLGSKTYTVNCNIVFSFSYKFGSKKESPVQLVS